MDSLPATDRCSFSFDQRCSTCFSLDRHGQLLLLAAPNRIDVKLSGQTYLHQINDSLRDHLWFVGGNEVEVRAGDRREETDNRRGVFTSHLSAKGPQRRPLRSIS
ncbi:hypothetical protein ACCUM_4369 [Candidatus Accumulibacter phosphatis]|uniref:Uncharacterized protein n=1 Tax=Candidatus Accumulibacter phosphatis TaxID=327160 RepID=A0A5S4EM31_9PROT|nr:hypothetical protein ACCUM_4369 [Candidatus Accumulibacter phosphatis]